MSKIGDIKNMRQFPRDKYVYVEDHTEEELKSQGFDYINVTGIIERMDGKFEIWTTSSNRPWMLNTMYLRIL